MSDLYPSTGPNNQPCLKFHDRYNQECIVMKSSHADDDCLWIGALDKNQKGKDGWILLSRKQVKYLIETLSRFVETGDIT